jgi:CRP/FNR family transcriptional regulator, cyclic AMP receptor protein
MTHWTDLIHSLAGLLIVASASSRTMVPLRILAIATNCFLIIYFSVLHAWLPMLLQAAALPLNAWRLYQMLILVSRVREAVRGKPSLDWLKPFMSERHFRKGDLLFAKGETADEMFYTMTGRYILVELGVEIPSGQLVGELAMVAPDNRRTATLECVEGGIVLSITYEQVEELYYQNPTFGFYLLKLATARLFDNLGRMEIELERRQAASAAVIP